MYLLVASMKLAISSANNLDLQLYKIVKHLQLELELGGFLSFSVLQARIITALCEMGHAIYPAAFLSIGYCVRYGVALGIDQDLKRIPSEPDAYSADGLEERRRAWWGILILDRFAHVISYA